MKSSRTLLCWLLAAQIVLSQSAGWEVNFSRTPPGTNIAAGKPFEIAFDVRDQQGNAIPHAPITITLDGAKTFNGDRVIMTETDDHGRVRVVGLIAISAGPVSAKIVAHLAGSPTPMLDRTFKWTATPKPLPVVRPYVKWLLIGGGVIGAVAAVAVTHGNGNTPAPQTTISAGTSTVGTP